MIFTVRFKQKFNAMENSLLCTQGVLDSNLGLCFRPSVLDIASAWQSDIK
jgi:hypothetical protein